MIRQKVFWGVNPQSNKKCVVVVQEFENYQVHIYTIDSHLLTKEQIDSLYRNVRISFPYPHEHIVHNANVSPILPTYARLNRPDVIEKYGKDLHQKSISQDVSNILFTEIDALHRKVNSASNFSPDFTKQAKHFSQEVKKKKRGGKIIPKDAYRLNQKISDIFEKSNLLYKKSCDRNYSLIKSRVNEAKSFAGYTSDWKKGRDTLSKVKDELKRISPLSKDQKDELWGKINEGFNSLNQRQKADRDKYENECNTNYNTLNAKANQCVSMASVTTDWKKAREFFKSAQTDMKGKKLKKDQRQVIYEKFQKAFEILSNRQKAAWKLNDDKGKANYARLSSKVSEAANLGAYSTDFKSARQKIKAIKQEVFDTRPMNRDQKSDLINRISNALQKLNARANADYEQRQRERAKKQAEWQARLRERIDKLESAIRRKEEGITRAGSALDRLHNNLYNVRPGRREYEIKESIRSKISNIESSIADRENQLREMRSKLYDMRSKLK